MEEFTGRFMMERATNSDYYSENGVAAMGLQVLNNWVCRKI
jgi:hypothetical protein